MVWRLLALTKARDNYGKALAFVEWVMLQQTGDCIIWPFTQHTNGYGSIGHGIRVHRLVCERAYGPPPEAQDAAHSCGVKLCVNPRHLRWATRSENEADKERHGTKARGERSGRAKLTAADVAFIRAASGTNREIARRFGISDVQVSAIRRGKSWRVD